MSDDQVMNRYRDDVTFRHLVDTMTSLIMKGDFTPNEMRLASIMASTNAEIRGRSLVTISKAEADKLGIIIGSGE